jgi:hypothetical protein
MNRHSGLLYALGRGAALWRQHATGKGRPFRRLVRWMRVAHKC